jgi:hypothetical protein
LLLLFDLGFRSLFAGDAHLKKCDAAKPVMAFTAAAAA